MAAAQSDKQQGVSGQTTWGDELKASTLNSKPGVWSKSLWEDHGRTGGAAEVFWGLWDHCGPIINPQLMQPLTWPQPEPQRSSGQALPQGRILSMAPALMSQLPHISCSPHLASFSYTMVDTAVPPTSQGRRDPLHPPIHSHTPHPV